MNRKNKILLDASYINTGGGEVLLNYFLDTIYKQNNLQSYIFIFDNRFIIPDFIDKRIQNIFICSNFVNRFILFFKIFIKYKPNTVFTINNLPPPFPIINSRCFIYFHNVLLLKNTSLNFSFKSFFKFYIKKNYIKILNNQLYNWVVQTDLVDDLLKKELNINNNKIFIIPFFKDNTPQNIFPKSESFIYVSDGGKHKNHDFILETWLFFFNEYRYTPKLLLTFDESKYPSLAMKVNRLKEIGLNILNIGTQKHEKIFDLYNESKYFLFFSEYESFGLPLIEAAQFEKYIFTCQKDYVFKIIEPSASFDIKNKDLFARYIYNLINNIIKPKPAILKVENKIIHLINKIENNV